MLNKVMGDFKKFEILNHRFEKREPIKSEFPTFISENTKIDKSNIFERLRNGEIIPSSDSQRKKLRSTSYDTKKLLVQMNNSSDPNEVRKLLSQITGSEIDESTAVFTPLYINYGKHIKIGKNVFINFDCVFVDLGGLTIEDNVLIASKVSLLSEGQILCHSDRSDSGVKNLY